MRLLDRYLLRELLAPFGLSLACLTIVLVINQLLRLMELFINRGVDLYSLLRILLIVLPSFLTIAIPIAVLIATTAAFSRLSMDGELIAMRSAGLGLLRLQAPVAAFSVGAYTVTMLLGLYAQPFGGVFLRQVETAAIEALQKHVAAGLEQGAFNDFMDGVMIYVREMPAPTEMTGIFIADTRDAKEPSLIAAKRGTVVSRPAEGTIQLDLHDGTLHQKGLAPETYQEIRFETYSLRLDLREAFRPLVTPRVEPLTIQQLREKVLDTGGEDMKWIRLLQDTYKNYFFPVAGLVFGPLGVVLGVRTRRTGRLGGFAIGLGLVVLYYALSIVGDFLVAAHLFGALAAAALPDVMFITLVAVLLWHQHRETPWVMGDTARK